MDQIGSYNIMGVNFNNAKAMKEALADYKAKLDEVLAKVTALEGASDYQQGFKGATQVAKIKDYVDKTVEEMHKMSDFINEFDTGLDNVMTNYQSKNEGTQTSAVNEASVEGAGDLTGVSKFNA